MSVLTGGLDGYWLECAVRWGLSAAGFARAGEPWAAYQSARRAARAAFRAHPELRGEW